MANEVAVMKFDEMERLADYMAKSNLFGIKTKEQAISLMALSQAEGLHPAIAARDYHIVQGGRPTLKADAMMARFQGAGGKVEWKEYTDKVVTGIFSHPQGGKVEITWTIEMAKAAGLFKNNVWSQYPRQMLRARTISEGIRTIYPGVAVGIYTPEEVEDFVDVTPEAKSLFKNASLRNTWFASVVDSFTSAKTLKELKTAVAGHKSKFDEMVENGNEHDLLAVDELRKRYEQIQARLKEEAEIDQTNYLDDDFRRSVDAEEKQAVEVNTPSVVVATAPSPATVALKHFRDGKPKWEYWVAEATDALNKTDNVSAWLTAHDNLLTALEIADKGLYEKVNAVAIERMG